MPYKYLSFYLDDWLSLLLYLYTPKDIKEIKERKATFVIRGFRIYCWNVRGLPTSVCLLLGSSQCTNFSQGAIFPPMHLMAFYAFLLVTC
jgi:hypothetical protein